MAKGHVEDFPRDRILGREVAQGLPGRGGCSTLLCRAEPELDDAGAHLADGLRRFQQARFVGELVAGANRLGADSVVEGVQVG